MATAFELGFGEQANQITVDALPVYGQLPTWLSGSLLRNGPGTLRVGEQRYRHWFDGLAMLHRFTFNGSQISYANRFLESRAYDRAQETGKISYSEFATDPCRSLFGRVMSLFVQPFSDSAKVNIAHLAGRYLALTEAPIQVEFNLETLRSVGVYQYERRTIGSMATVHPQIDAQNGRTYNLITSYNAFSTYRFYQIEAGGATRRIGTLPVSEPSYLHSFGMSEHYFVVADFPLKVSPLDLLLWLRPYIENFRWKPQLGTPFFVVDRTTGATVARFETEAFFAFHHVNTFERGGDLFVDVIGYDDAGIIQAAYLDRLADPQARLAWGILRRYRLPLGKPRSCVTFETLSDTALELPRFDEERFNSNGAYRYVYGVSLQAANPAGFYNQIAKIDVQTGKTCTWHAPDCFPGEPVFVGTPGRSAEDDGVVMSLVLDAARGISFLLVLDAQTFSERARAELPHAVLHGFHGAFFADEAPKAREVNG